VFDESSSSLPTEKIFQEASVLLAPIRIGGGTSYKILESMSSGTPVVTMQMSADALSAKDEQNLMVGNTSQELAEKSLSLLSDDALYKTIAKNGRELVEKNYTWKEIGKKLEEAYQKAVVY
jgi:glycosyltransferase involved in cell wall biosynthesis